MTIKEMVQTHIPTEKCSVCNGTGKVVDKILGKRCVNCASVSHRHFWSPSQYGIKPFSCKNRDCPATRPVSFKVRTCSDCCGKGRIEIRPFNPVIPINNKNHSHLYV